MPWDFWLIFFVLGVVLPWRGYTRLQVLLAKPKVDSRERLSLYASTIAFQWVAAGIGWWRAWAHGISLSQLGFRPPDQVVSAIAGVVGGAILFTAHWFNLRRAGRADPRLRSRFQALAERILPQSGPELALFMVLSFTAGICEEFLYRGFAFAALSGAGLVPWVTLLFSSVLFGMAHLYQGRRGFVSTFILGIVFGIARIAYHGVVPAMIWHTAVDLAAGMAGARYLIHNRTTVLAARDGPQKSE